MENQKKTLDNNECKDSAFMDSNMNSQSKPQTAPDSRHHPQHDPPDRKRKIHMNNVQCFSHSKTSDGARSLTTPNPQGLAKKPHFDVNKGLYPRQPQPKGTFSHTPAMTHPGARQYSPGASQHAYGSQQHSPRTRQQSPSTRQYSPSTKQYHPGASQHSPGSQQHSPGTRQQSPSTRQYSPNTKLYKTTKLCSPGAKPYSPGTKLYNPETRPHSPGSRRYTYTSPQKQSPSSNRQSSVSGSPMKQSAIKTYFPVSPAKTSSHSSCSTTNKQGKPYGTDVKHQTSSNVFQSQRNNTTGSCSTDAFNKPSSNTGVKPKTWQRPWQSASSKRSSPSTQSLIPKNVGNSGSQSAHTPVRSLFQSKGRPSTNLVQEFEDDDFITAEMFDSVVGASQIHQDTIAKPQTSSSPQKQSAGSMSRDNQSDDQVLVSKKRKDTRSLEEQFEEDESLTVSEFDDILQSSQGSAKDTDEKEKPSLSSLEKAFEEDDFFTVEEFDEILQSSQSPAKTGPNLTKQDQPSTSKCNRFDQPGPSTEPCTFGLLGEDWRHQEENSEIVKNFFNIVPNEVLENILGQLPILDLCLTAAPVCKRWNGIISGKLFVPWKKRYHKLKKQPTSEHKQNMQTVLKEGGQKLEEGTCLMHMINFVTTLRLSTGSAFDSLRRHPKFNSAVAVMKERIPKVFSNQEPHMWSTVAAIIVLSETAQEVCQILDLLLQGNQPASRIEVSECFYCIASALFLFQIKYDINRGLHYRLFNALHTLESSEVVDDDELSDTAKTSKTGQTSLLRFGQRHGIKLTPEQLRIINHKLVPTDIIKIIAFAGTGKTTTLVRFAQLRPHMRFLYIAFNKTVQEQALKRFPDNVECRTLHSLAYKAVGFRYSRKLGFSLKPYYVSKILPRMNDPGVHHMTMAKYVCSTIESFLASDDQHITTVHTPVRGNTRNRDLLAHHLRMIIANTAEKVFTTLCDVRNQEAKITHDVYLKLYELQRPTLHGFDCLLIDEAQDLSAAQQSILLGQSFAKILVGDPHQQIYSFRGASNAMARVEATRIYHLTESFRFGPEIAYVANCLLESLKNQTKRTIIGAGPPGHVLGHSTGQVATLCRSNAKVFTEAVKMVTKNENIRIEFSGGVKGYGFDKTLDIYYLSLPEAERGGYCMRDKFVGRFKSLATLQSYANNADDIDLQSRIKLVLLYHSRIPALIQKIERSAVVANGDVVLSTAHKAKGLEFDTVQLTEDFLDESIMESARATGQTVPEDEKNILYVAVTRAKKCLMLNHMLLHCLLKLNERFEYPTLAREVREGEGDKKCQECGVEQTDDKQLLVLQRREIKMFPSTGQRSVEAGIVCSKCADVPGFEGLYGKEVVIKLMDEVEEDRLYGIGFFNFLGIGVVNGGVWAQL